jgi:dTDP-4-dehydrorhamnose reductase
MKVLILGGAGQVARAVEQAVPADHRVEVKSRSELDIADSTAMALALDSIRPDWLINAAAYTAVDLAEDQREQAIAINDTAVGALAQATSRAGCRLLHLSTDFVFDGRTNVAYLPTDAPNPLSVYGISKLGGERRVLTGDSSGIVLRTAWVYAAAGRNFALTMLRLMAERDQVKVVCDQIGTPTWAASIASAIWGLIDAEAPPGVYHWTDLGVASWYDFAVAIQDEALARGLLTRAVPILPISTAEYPTRARRPAFSVLNTAATHALTKLPGHHWRHSLRNMLDELRAT